MLEYFAESGILYIAIPHTMCADRGLGWGTLIATATGKL